VDKVFLENPELTPVGFADFYMGLKDMGDWQAEAVMPLCEARVAEKRVNITIVAPNGSGKDQRIIPVAAYWWLNLHKKGRVVITSKSDMQITEQTIPALDAYYERFGWKPPTRSPRYTLTTPTGGKLIAFVTNDAGRVEGWHERAASAFEPESPLLLIVNEAKSVDDLIFSALDRCTPTAVIYISSPGGREGRFWETHAKIAGWNRIKAGLADCPWIPKERIDAILATYGPDDPFTRSTLYGEFMEQTEDQFFCLLEREYDACVESPPLHQPGMKFGFWDFADGRAKNVLVMRDGNKYEIREAFREKNEDAVVGRAIMTMKRSGLTPQQFAGDAAAKSILDKLAAAGWPIRRMNFGMAMPDTQYKSWSVFAWIETCNKIKRREIIIPDSAELKGQLCTRRKKFAPDGKFALEDKYIMKRERGIDSPDEADAFCGAAAQMDTISMLGPTSNSTLNMFNPRRRVGACVGL
jgi:hypothetical protein